MLAAVESFNWPRQLYFFCIFLTRVHFDGIMKEHETEEFNGKDGLKGQSPP